METVNKSYYDESLLHQLEVQDFIQELIKSFLSSINQSNFEINKILKEALPVSSNPKSKSYKSLLSSIKESRDTALLNAKETFLSKFYEFVKNEKDLEHNLLKSSIPINYPIKQIKNPLDEILNTPFQVSKNQSAVLDSLLKSISTSDINHIESAIQLGLSQGKSTNEIITSLRGTKKAGFKDGVYQTTKNQATAIVTTLVNHASNSIKQLTFEANSDIIIAVRWVAVLDLRTSAICRYRDGRYSPVGNHTLPPSLPRLEPIGAKPPAHFHCRSVLVGVVSLDGVIGERPFVNGEQVNFQQLAKEKYGPNWNNLSRKEMDRLTQLIKEKWLADNVGSVPSDTTYYEWLFTLPVASQIKVLGPTRVGLLNSGKVKISDLYDKFGNLLTLKLVNQS
jgi:Phage Mu protein F like protein